MAVQIETRVLSAGFEANQTIGKTLCTGWHVYTSGSIKLRSSTDHLRTSPDVPNYITKIIRSGTDSSALSTRRSVACQRTLSGRPPGQTENLHVGLKLCAKPTPTDAFSTLADAFSVINAATTRAIAGRLRSQEFGSGSPHVAAHTGPNNSLRKFHTLF